MNVAQQAWDAGNFAYVQRLLNDHRLPSGESDIRGFEWRLLWRWLRESRRMLFESEDFGDMYQLQFSNNGAYLAGLREQTPLIMDFAARRPVKIANMTTNALTLAFRPKTTLLVTGQENGEIQWWDVGGKQFLFRMAAHASNVTALAFSPDGNTLASAGDDGRLLLWNVNTRQSELVFRSPGAVQSVRFSPDGSRLAALVGNSVRFVDSTTRHISSAASGTNVYAFAFSPNGRAMAIATSAGGWLLDLESGKERPFAVSLHNLENLVFMPDGRKVLAWGWNGLMAWDPEKGTQAPPFKGFFNMTAGLAFAPDGQTLAASGAKSLTIWRTADSDGLNTTAEFDSENYEMLAFSGDSSVLAFARRGMVVSLRELLAPAFNGGELILADGANCGAFSPDGKTLAIGEGHGQVDLWELGKPRLRSVLNGHSADVKVLAFARDSLSLFTGSDDGKVLRWNVTTVESSILQAGQGPVRAMALSREGGILATCSRDVDINLWDLEKNLLITNLHGHHTSLRAMEFSPDGKLLASADYGGTLALWDVAARRSTALFQAHTAGIRALAFAPDGRTLATASYDRTACLWNTATHRLMLTLEHPALVANVRFSPDGRFLATTCQDGKVRLWRAASFSEIPAEERPAATAP
jgi:WD40 repeat protein